MLWIFNQFSGHLVCEINHGRFDDFITSFVPSSIYKFMGSFRVVWTWWWSSQFWPSRAGLMIDWVSNDVSTDFLSISLGFFLGDWVQGELTGGDDGQSNSIRPIVFLVIRSSIYPPLEMTMINARGM